MPNGKIWISSNTWIIVTIAVESRYIWCIRIECDGEIVVLMPITVHSTHKSTNKNSHRSELVRTILLLREHSWEMRARGLSLCPHYNLQHKFRSHTMKTPACSRSTVSFPNVRLAQPKRKLERKYFFKYFSKNIALWMLLLLWNLIIGFWRLRFKLAIAAAKQLLRYALLSWH